MQTTILSLCCLGLLLTGSVVPAAAGTSQVPTAPPLTKQGPKAASLHGPLGNGSPPTSQNQSQNKDGNKTTDPFFGRKAEPKQQPQKK